MLLSNTVLPVCLLSVSLSSFARHPADAIGALPVQG